MNRRDLLRSIAAAGLVLAVDPAFLSFSEPRIWHLGAIREPDVGRPLAITIDPGVPDHEIWLRNSFSSTTHRIWWSTTPNRDRGSDLWPEKTSNAGQERDLLLSWHENPFS